MRAVQEGFRRPVFDAQSTFRSVLDALAEPGTVRTISADVPELGLAPAGVATLLSLVDIDTPLWLSPSLVDELGPYVRFHTGATLTDSTSDAAFAVVGSLGELPALDAFNPGTAMSPELSTTVIVAVGDFVSGTPAVLEGPGFEHPRTLAPAGFDAALWTALAQNHARFPSGIDLLLVSGTSVVGLPRSTRIPFPTDNNLEG